jgi:hypothetical protein
MDGRKTADTQDGFHIRGRTRFCVPTMFRQQINKIRYVLIEIFCLNFYRYVATWSSAVPEVCLWLKGTITKVGKLPKTYIIYP